MQINSEYEKPFSVKVLDSNFDLVTILKYSDLQWSRKYNEPGQFVIDGAVGHVAYSKTTWKYVYSEKRKELGKITQVNWKKTPTKNNLTLSGLFVEDELNKMICYKKPTAYYNDAGTNYGVSINKLNDTPDWLEQNDTADVVATNFFNGFKHINFTNYLIGDFSGDLLVTKDFELDIIFGRIDDSHGTYKQAVHTRNNERLGDKLYDILKESGASYEIVFDYANKTKTLNIIHGIDRTQDNYLEGYNPVVLTSANGSIKSASVVVSETDTKDTVIQVGTNNETTLVLANTFIDSTGRFLVESMVSAQSDYINDDTQDFQKADKDHKLAVMSDASKDLYDKRDKINIQFDFVNSSYEYMVDFDLGDFVSIEIPEIDLSVDVQIIGCYEVIKKGVWSLSFEVGTPIIRKRGSM